VFFAASVFAAQGDIIIPAGEISSNAKFYSSQIDGTTIEILAVKASDGSIRTAFNTCQSCYGSGRGYYKQSGNVLICQNCQNRFTIDQVELSKSGCNPIPITAKDKRIEGKNIIISKEFLAKSKGKFANWKK
jgi:uncharacterized membrane protein